MPWVSTAAAAAEANGIPSEAPWDDLWAQYTGSLQNTPDEALVRAAATHSAAAMRGCVFDREVSDSQVVHPSSLTEAPWVPSGKRLFPHQLAGISFLLGRRAIGASCILADDMGKWSRREAK